MKIRPMGAELFHADRRTYGRTEMTKLIFAFCNFANAPKNEFIVWPWITRRLYLQILALSAI
jgi:hypothetical protein